MPPLYAATAIEVSSEQGERLLGHIANLKTEKHKWSAIRPGLRQKHDELRKQLDECEDAYLHFRYTYLGQVYMQVYMPERKREEHKIALDVHRLRLFDLRDELD